MVDGRAGGRGRGGAACRPPPGTALDEKNRGLGKSDTGSGLIVPGGVLEDMESQEHLIRILSSIQIVGG